MPLLALEKFCTHISKKYFYTFGQKCVTNAYLILFTTLFSICFFSYSALLDYTYPHSQSTNDFIDAHLWQFSPHVHVTKSNTTSGFIAQQVHVSTLDDEITKELLKNTLSIYDAMATSRISRNGQTIALDDICAKTPYASCIVHSPLAYWNNDFDRIERDTDPITTINKRMQRDEKRTRLSLHPYSTMGNVKLDNQGHFISADSLIITFVLKNTSSTLEIWNQLYQHVVNPLEATERRLDVRSYILQYKLRILPSPSTHTLVVISATLGLFFLLKAQFGRSELIKSKSGLALTTLFLSLSCYTVTKGLFHFLDIEMHVLPWLLSILVCTTTTLEHVLLLTGAVVTSATNKEKEMSVKERMATGLQHVGISMTCTLLGELIVLGTGSAIKTTHVRSFCIFASLALVVAYLLNLTFFMAVLSIDIKRGELTDLGNEGLQGEKSASHINQQSGNYGHGNKSKRAINALFLCLVLLSLSVLSPNDAITTPTKQFDKRKYDQLASISDQFWTLINPSYTTQWLEVQPPYVVILSNHTSQAEKQIDHLTFYYNKKLSTLATSLAADGGKFDVLLDSLQPYLLLLFSINVPSILLFYILVCIMMWMTPSLRERFLLPFARMIYVRSFTFILRIVSKTTPFSVDSIIRRVETSYYNEDGVHIGAISIQSEYNKLQTKNHVRNVKIHTLAGVHIADIRQLSSSSSNGKTVSIGQDGKIVLWDNEGGQWIARLDRLRRLGGGCNGWVAERSSSSGLLEDVKKSDIKCLPRARCVQVSQDGKYVVAGFENGMVRVWNATTVHLLRELSLVQSKEGAATTVENRHGDRVIHLAFLDEKEEGVQDANEKTNNTLKLSEQQHFIVSIHKDGRLREWNLKTGEMTNCIVSGHTREITAINILTDNQQESSRQFIFTASEDGTVKCWERRDIDSSTKWSRKYSISDGQGVTSVTSVAAQQMKNGAGIVVTGSSDRSVKVWNLDSGDAICTLSQGRGCSNKEAQMAVSDHQDSISQVVVTPISNPEFDNDTCPSCNTALNNGFFVASCSLDGTVHAWRLSSSLLHKDIGCSRCRKDYHPQYMRRSAPAPVSSTTSVGVGPISALRSQQRKLYYSTLSAANSDDEEADSLPSAAEESLSLTPLFLGKLHQFAGHGLVFCKNMVLTGVRRHTAPGISMNLVSSSSSPLSLHQQQQQQDNQRGEWDVWFTSLQYYEPPPNTTEDAASWMIPVITYDLEKDEIYYREQTIEENEDQQHSNSLWDWFLLRALGVRKVSNVCHHTAASISRPLKSNIIIHWHISDKEEEEEEEFDSSSSSQEDQGADVTEDEENEAYDVLPFSAIRHVVSTNNGYGLSCDYGNFIKIVSFDGGPNNSN